MFMGLPIVLASARRTGAARSRILLYISAAKCKIGKKGLDENMN
jgi:hypothetical protein